MATDALMVVLRTLVTFHNEFVGDLAVEEPSVSWIMSARPVDLRAVTTPALLALEPSQVDAIILRHEVGVEPGEAPAFDALRILREVAALGARPLLATPDEGSPPLARDFPFRSLVGDGPEEVGPGGSAEGGHLGARVQACLRLLEGPRGPILCRHASPEESAVLAPAVTRLSIDAVRTLTNDLLQAVDVVAAGGGRAAHPVGGHHGFGAGVGAGAGAGVGAGAVVGGGDAPFVPGTLAQLVGDVQVGANPVLQELLGRSAALLPTLLRLLLERLAHVDILGGLPAQMQHELPVGAEEALDGALRAAFPNDPQGEMKAVGAVVQALLDPEMHRRVESVAGLDTTPLRDFLVFDAVVGREDPVVSALPPALLARPHFGRTLRHLFRTHAQLRALVLDQDLAHAKAAGGWAKWVPFAGEPTLASVWGPKGPIPAPALAPALAPAPVGALPVGPSGVAAAAATGDDIEMGGVVEPVPEEVLSWPQSSVSHWLEAVVGLGPGDLTAIARRGLVGFQLADLSAEELLGMGVSAEGAARTLQALMDGRWQAEVGGGPGPRDSHAPSRDVVLTWDEGQVLAWAAGVPGVTPEDVEALEACLMNGDMLCDGDQATLVQDLCGFDVSEGGAVAIATARDACGWGPSP